MGKSLLARKCRFGFAVVQRDLEVCFVALGVIFAMTLPAALKLQSKAFDDGVMSKNVMVLLCTEPKFRDYTVEVLNMTGFDFRANLGNQNWIDTRHVLQNPDAWKWDDSSANAIYSCQNHKEIATTSRIMIAALPRWAIDTWALMHPSSPLWSDHLSSMASFGLYLMLVGFFGCILLYVSLQMSPSKYDSTGHRLRQWCTIGVPLLGLDVAILISGIICLFFANDAYSHSQDAFFMVDGRMGSMGSMARIATITIFAPGLCVYFLLSGVALFKSYFGGKAGKEEDEDVGARQSMGGRPSLVRDEHGAVRLEYVQDRDSSSQRESNSLADRPSMAARVRQEYGKSATSTSDGSLANRSSRSEFGV